MYNMLAYNMEIISIYELSLHEFFFFSWKELEGD